MTKHQVTNTLRNPLLVIVGPTASGKTEVAYEISKRLPVEMISCDSMQVYRKMPIVTQTPPRSVTRNLKTHLVSFLDPSKEYNAALFRQDALSSIHKILAKGKTPLIVGGTGLYLRALLDGLFESKDSGILKDEELRETLMNEQKTHGGYFLHARLERVDPLSAKKIHPHDLRRIVRALEVFHLTGKPLSAQAANRKGIRAEYSHRIFLLNRDRTDLYERINTRVDQMLKTGLLKEVKRLGSSRLGLTAHTALGIPEMTAYLEGKSSLATAVELLKKNTRNYAKRQLSWFRHEKGVEMMDVSKDEDASGIAERIVKKWSEFLEPR